MQERLYFTCTDHLDDYTFPQYNCDVSSAGPVGEDMQCKPQFIFCKSICMEILHVLYVGTTINNEFVVSFCMF